MKYARPREAGGGLLILQLSTNLREISHYPAGEGAKVIIQNGGLEDVTLGRQLKDHKEGTGRQFGDCVNLRRPSFPGLEVTITRYRVTYDGAEAGEGEGEAGGEAPHAEEDDQQRHQQVRGVLQQVRVEQSILQT